MKTSSPGTDIIRQSNLPDDSREENTHYVQKNIELRNWLLIIANKIDDE